MCLDFPWCSVWFCLVGYFCCGWSAPESSWKSKRDCFGVKMTPELLPVPVVGTETCVSLLHLAVCFGMFGGIYSLDTSNVWLKEAKQSTNYQGEVELRHVNQVNFISLEGSGTQILRSSCGSWGSLAWRKGGWAGTLSLPSYLKGGCSKVRVGLLSRVTEQGERA